MRRQDTVKLFQLSHQMLERALDGVEVACAVDLRREVASQADRDDQFYPQFDVAVRDEAEAMASHYELFYCLERSLRTTIRDTLQATQGPSWWQAVPEKVRVEAEANMRRELDSAVTPRSTEETDYTTFGQLGDIVRANWESFADIFSSERAFTKVMSSLNTLRGPIAHCCPLSPNEVVRLSLTVEDWFRLMS